MSEAMVPLLEPYAERDVEGVPGLREIRISGEPHLAAIVNAVAANYHRLSGRSKPEQQDLEKLFGEKVTLVMRGTNMLGAGAIAAWQGRLSIGNNYPLILKPKGARTRGYGVNPERVLDLLPGYDGLGAQKLVDGVRAHFPPLRPLTQERLLELPPYSPGNDCRLALFGSWQTPAGSCADALWLAGAYEAEDDIVDSCVLLVRPEAGISESGSVYGRQLLNARALGEVVGFEPLSFGAAVRLCDDEHEHALARVFGGLVEAVAA